jgi:hypothetical protein
MNENEVVKTLKELQSATETLLGNAAEFKDRFRKDAINWGDLHCRETYYCISDEGEDSFQVWVSECDPGAGELKRYLVENLQVHYEDTDITVITEW